jgi:hypothetical protein
MAETDHPQIERLQPMTGSVGILNVGAGDDKLVFDRDDPASMIRGARIVRDMIRRGYALLVAVPNPAGGEPTYQRAYDFREDTCEYIIADLDPDQATDETTHEKDEAASTAEAGIEAGTPHPRPAKRRGRPPTKRVHAADTKVVAVSRTAGG